MIIIDSVMQIYTLALLSQPKEKNRIQLQIKSMILIKRKTEEKVYLWYQMISKTIKSLS